MAPRWIVAARSLELSFGLPTLTIEAKLLEGLRSDRIKSQAGNVRFERLLHIEATKQESGIYLNPDTFICIGQTIAPLSTGVHLISLGRECYSVRVVGERFRVYFSTSQVTEFAHDRLLAPGFWEVARVDFTASSAFSDDLDAGIRVIASQIAFSRIDVDRALSRSYAAASNIPRRGRKPKYNADLIRDEARRYMTIRLAHSVRDSDHPLKLVDLERHVQNWLIGSDMQTPSESRMRDFVTPIFCELTKK